MRWSRSDPKRDADFLRTSRGNSKEELAVFTHPSIAFSEIERNRRARGSHLIGQLTIMNPHLPNEVRKGSDDLKSKLKSKETHSGNL